MSSKGRFLLGIVLGAAGGVIAALALAPRPGEETREMLKDEMEKQYNASVDALDHRLEDIGQQVDLGKQKLVSAVDSVEAKMTLAKKEIQDRVTEKAHYLSDSAESLKIKALQIAEELEETGRQALNKLPENLPFGKKSEK